MSARRIYLDHAATTPLDPRVLEAMLPYFQDAYGNPSSVHRWGQEAEAAVERARSRMASNLGCAPEEIVFTACGSESDNLALRGAAFAARQSRGANHLLVSPVEHDAVLVTAEQLQQVHGFDLELLPVDQHGTVDPEEVSPRLRSDTALVSVIYANNEIGSINDIAEIGAACRQQGVWLHTDAVQAASQLSVHVEDLCVDLLSLGAHKFYGPKGVGALYVRQGITLIPSLTGGSQERHRRAGTHNVPLIVGMAEALDLTVQARARRNQGYERLRDWILDDVPATIPGAQPTGHLEERLPNHASFVFEGVDGNQLLAALDLAGFACSSGSACKTGDPRPSRVLLAIGLQPDLALGSLRVTLGKDTTQDDVGQLLTELPPLVERLRAAEAVAR